MLAKIEQPNRLFPIDLFTMMHFLIELMLRIERYILKVGMVEELSSNYSIPS